MSKKESQQETVATEIMPRTWTRVKAVTRSVRKLEKDVPVILRIDGPIQLGKAMKAKPGEEQKKPAMTCNVTDMETGEVHVLICNAVLHSELLESYPDDGYVGKIFEIINQGKLPGRNYMTYSICEMAEG